MNFRVAFLAANLQDHFPRGARRAARAIVEIISNSKPKNPDYFCILGKLPTSRPLSFVSENLQEWLANNSLFLPTQKNKQTLFQKTRHILKQFLPPIFLPLFKGVLNFARMLKNTFCKIINLMVQKKNEIPQNEIIKNEISQQNKIITLDEIDALISFEPFDEPWSLNLERHSVLKIGWFYDAVPKRIHEGQFWNPDFFDYCTGLMVLRSDHIFCDSKSAEKDLHYFFPLSEGKTSVIHLGHDIVRFSKYKPSGLINQTLKELKINPIIPFFLFVGTVEPRKNITGILLAAQKLKQDFPEEQFQLVIAGNIHGQTDILELIEQTNNFVPVHTTQYATDDLVVELMHKSVAFLFPSLWEGFGIPNLEAMTAETLVITSDLGPMPEVCAEHALYCDPYDHRSIAKKMHEALKMPREERKTRIEAAKLYASQFTWEKAAQKMMAKVEELLAEKQNKLS